MLPELIAREEELQNYPLLSALGLVSVLVGFMFARYLFPAEVGLLTVIFGSIPLIYPLTKFFLEDEENGRPHTSEVMVYGSIFIGELFSFILLGTLYPNQFMIQNSIISGNAVAMGPFASILVNNLRVFAVILLMATLIGSAGSFILTWNASILGLFIADLISRISTAKDMLACDLASPSPLCYMPHATFEMGGFIIAGISGSLMSAAIYREHFNPDTWKDLLLLAGAGLLMIIGGAILETGGVLATLTVLTAAAGVLLFIERNAV